jgi:hypothetical protein
MGQELIVINNNEVQQAKELLRLLKKRKKHEKFLKSLPMIEDSMILEYRDLAGYWYEYTQDLKNNMFFHPDKLRVRQK